VLIQKTALIIFTSAFFVSQAHAQSVEESDAGSEWFWHLSAAGSVIHLNDEGAPYRLSLGAGRPFYMDGLSIKANLVYSYYEVNEVADNNPSSDVVGGYSHSLGIDLLLRWSLSQTPSVSYYLEGGGGIQGLVSGPPFPADGSN
jgi:hypothetical protein